MDRAKLVGALAAVAGWVVAKTPGVAGAVLISSAGWLVYEPAGLALAGAFCLAADWRNR